eukprot:m.355967 g.355967  ORF g.355967 m.355967 type:complete len:616 (-) comp17398_c0_seq1:308-2155(-)
MTSVEELVAFGVDAKKAEQTAKNKKLSQACREFFDLGKEVGGADAAASIGKVLFDVASKVNATVPQAFKKVLVEYLLKPEGKNVSSPAQIKAATAFLNSATEDTFTVASFEEAAGVGVVVMPEDITTAVKKVVAADQAKIEELGWGYQAKIMQGARQLLPFADGKSVRDEVTAQLEGILGANTGNSKAKHKEKLKQARKEKKVAAKEDTAAVAEDGAAVEVAAPATGAQKVTPWEVEADGDVNYDKLIDDFGSKKLEPEHLEKMKKLGMPIHHFLRRDIFFSHRAFDDILTKKENGEPIYLYTGRGPSSQAMHLGHLIPFLFTKYLQEVLDCPLVIQMTDDEKFLFKPNLTLDDNPETGVFHMLRENVKDIIAIGFDPKKTFIFSDVEFMGGAFYKNVLRIQRRINLNTAMKVFGFELEHNIGRIAFCAIQASPSFPSSFPFMLDPKAACLIPCAIDQDPYFRLTRDVAPSLKEEKPALLHSKFFPAMSGASGKMSSSTNSPTTVFLTDDPDSISEKIHKHAVSGAPETLAELREKGANTDKDVSFQYLRFFMEDDAELERIRVAYSTGKMSTFEIKEILVGVLQDVVRQHQERRAKVTDADVDYFMSQAKFAEQ